MTECNGCGSCCDPVVLPYTPLDAAEDYTLDDRTRQWVMYDLKPMSRRQVLEREPWLLDKSTRLSASPDGGDLFVPYFYSCRWFDPAERSCTNWNDRPAPCRAYPWGDAEPVKTAALPPSCSFRADIGQPVYVRPTCKVTGCNARPRREVDGRVLLCDVHADEYAAHAEHDWR